MTRLNLAFKSDRSPLAVGGYGAFKRRDRTQLSCSTTALKKAVQTLSAS
ncbi:MAG: hypothetical protein MUD14_07465 [Hydrococcus sp. Prado102]|nr:hypothetical protein [Hydrococcus sp. Prado102]